MSWLEMLGLKKPEPTSTPMDDREMVRHAYSIFKQWDAPCGSQLLQATGSLKEILIQEYEILLSEYPHLESSGNSDMRSWYELLRFVLAAGVFAFGRRDAVFDLVNFLPAEGGARDIGMYLRCRLPIPEELNLLHNPQEVNECLVANLHRFEWDEVQEKYVEKT